MNIGVMWKRLSYCSAVALPALGFSLETKPWLGNVWEWHFSSTYSYSSFPRVQGASVQIRHPSHDQLLRLDFSVTPADIWDIEMEIEFVNTPRQSWGYRSAALQSRIQWCNDITGDPVSWSTGLNVREVSRHSLHDVSCPYHSDVDVEVVSSLGKEWSKGPFWTVRGWTNLGLGIANHGSPWLHLLGVLEKNWNNHHRLILFTEGYFGFGDKQKVDVDHFAGWAKFGHHSIDLGIGYQYHFDRWGDITMTYARRVYAHTFPEDVNFFTLVYQLPFSLL